MELSPLSNESYSPSLHDLKIIVENQYKVVQPQQMAMQQNNSVQPSLLDQNAQHGNNQDREADTVDLTGWLSPRKIVFNKDQESGRLSITVIDKVTQEVIQEIPPERVLEMLNKIQKNLGYLIDQEA